MAGVLFVVCVPSAQYEQELSQRPLTEDLNRRDSKGPQTSTPADLHHNGLLQGRTFIPHNIKSNGITGNDESVILIHDELCQDDRTPIALCKKPENVFVGGAEALKKSWDGFRELVGQTSAILAEKRGGSRKLLEENYDDDGGRSEGPLMPMEKVLRELLISMGVDNAVWCDGKGGRYYQVLFSIESGASCERVLQVFSDCGIGLRLNSAVSVIPCALYYQGDPPEGAQGGTLNARDRNNGDGGSGSSDDENNAAHPKASSAWDKFVQSVGARLTVAQVVESVKAEAAWTFDFMILLIIAAFLAALGLVEDSTVFLVSSMLISPLMGPIIAGTFGTCIHDRSLMRLGVVNEMLGILLTMFIGFLFGLVICMIDDRYGVGEWPTNEMLSKCEIRSLWVGALIAFPSGAAGALAVLGDNTGSLVGVAISASLLPPAVNAGLVWAMSFSYLIWQNNSTKFNTIVDTQQYSSNQAVELAVMGFISLCLTLVNVICIYAAGILVLKVKEVAPLRSSSARHFWRHDVRIARDYNRTLRGDEARNLANDLLAKKNTKLVNGMKHARDYNRRYSEAYGLSLEQNRMRQLRERLNQWTWSPAPVEPERPTIRDLKSLYESLTGERYEGNRMGIGGSNNGVGSGVNNAKPRR
ncbi:uncharacterized protein LOC113388529 [Ctenocephalides felis]|uniref:uncharacterized protein LOC113388529 n=1 Tax=Ctenocephalides felis TaxID=7515 RepID=UPI000E6E414C|nr:uncharacterized protein LOC113388529 [Ctenocephalides felis]